jgi:small GTP-binding protein
MVSEDNIYKIILVGEGGVGKTSLIKTFVYQKFDDKYLKTLGTNVSKKDVNLGPKLNNETAHLQIWDVLGQKAFQSIIKSAFKGAQGVMFVCDLTDFNSLKRLEAWVNYAYEFGPRASFIFLANKSDLEDHKFGQAELDKIAKSFNAPAYITSAKSGDQVEEAFTHLGRSIHQYEFAPPKESVKLSDGQPVDIPANIKAEDYIINLFCTEAGGYQVTMPIVRQHFQKHGIDFENPTREDLLKVANSLTKYLVFIKGDEVAKEYYRMMRRALKEIGY